MSAPPERPRRSRAPVVVGIVVIVASVLGAVLLYVLGLRQADESVRQLARAPVGCDTTLEFTETGTFVLFIETAGRLDRLAGGCDVPTAYRRDARPARLSVELVDRDGVELSLDRTDESSYDNDGFVASSFRQVEIAESGRHVLRVTSPEGDFVVSIGRDPGDVSRSLMAGALATGVFGAIAGVALVTIGAVRRRSSAAGAIGVAPPGPPSTLPWDGAPPTAPPLAPPPPGAPLPTPAGPAAPHPPLSPPAQPERPLAPPPNLPPSSPSSTPSSTPGAPSSSPFEPPRTDPASPGAQPWTAPHEPPADDRTDPA